MTTDESPTQFRRPGIDGSVNAWQRFGVILRTIGLLLGLLILPARGQGVVDASTTLQVGGEIAYIPLVMVSSTPEIRVKSSRMYIEEDAVVVVGEVINEAAFPVSLVEIDARFFNGDQPAGTAKGFGLVQTVEAGQQSPFFIVMAVGGLPSVTRYELSLRWTSGGQAKFRPVTVISSNGRVNGGVEVVTQLRNDHSQSLIDVRSTAVFYDQADAVIWVATGREPINVLVPAATAEYRITTFRPKTWTRLAIFSEGRVEP